MPHDLMHPGLPIDLVAEIASARTSTSRGSGSSTTSRRGGGGMRTDIQWNLWIATGSHCMGHTSTASLRSLPEVE
jgi:hypothetical protein